MVDTSSENDKSETCLLAGLFADEPALLDQVVVQAMQIHEKQLLRNYDSSGYLPQ